MAGMTHAAGGLPGANKSSKAATVVTLLKWGKLGSRLSSGDDNSILVYNLNIAGLS